MTTLARLRRRGTRAIGTLAVVASARVSAPRTGFFVGTAIVIGSAAASDCGRYDASLGTPPEDQGWVITTSGPTTVTLADGALNVTTLPFSNGACPTPSEQQYINWRIDDAGLDFDDGPVLEARVEVHTSQYGSNTCTGWPRPGFLLLASDIDGRSYRVGLGSTQVFLANDGYLPFGDPGVAEADFITTDGFHTYRLEMSSAMAVLLIDGVPTLSVGAGSTTAASSLAAFGDSTVWANAEVSVEWVEVTVPDCCPADLDGSGDVGFGDLIAMLSVWGACPAPCPEDLDDSGDVGFGDLVLLLSTWGPCG